VTPSLAPVDLIHDGLPGAISAWVVLEPEPMVIDPGPTASLGNLRNGLEQLGLSVSDLRRIVLTHIHLDHAGGSGALVRENPALEVVVHHEGAPHMADPSKLDASTRRTFGEAHDRLWGPVVPVPADRIRAWNPNEPGSVPGLQVIATPGHIASHLSYLHALSGTLVAGDALGILLGPGADPHPPTPPPSLDLAAWHDTLARLQQIEAESTGVAHFGGHARPPAELASLLRERLRDVTDRVHDARTRGAVEPDALEQDAQAYEEEVRTRMARVRSRAEVDRYFDVFRGSTDYAGVAFHLKRLQQAN